jgi:hypothetical protein
MVNIFTRGNHYGRREDRLHEFSALPAPGTRGETFGGNGALVSAMLDRLLHHSHFLMMQGESWRLKSERRAGVLRGSSAEAVGYISFADATGGSDFECR